MYKFEEWVMVLLLGGVMFISLMAFLYQNRIPPWDYLITVWALAVTSIILMYRL